MEKTTLTAGWDGEWFRRAYDANGDPVGSSVCEEGQIFIEPGDINQYVGIYQPRDGRDHLLYTLPETGLSVLKVIPAVRNKVNTTDLNGPSAQPHWVNGNDEIRIGLVFD